MGGSGAMRASVDRLDPSGARPKPRRVGLSASRRSRRIRRIDATAAGQMRRPNRDPCAMEQDATARLPSNDLARRHRPPRRLGPWLAASGPLHTLLACAGRAGIGIADLTVIRDDDDIAMRGDRRLPLRRHDRTPRRARATGPARSATGAHGSTARSSTLEPERRAAARRRAARVPRTARRRRPVVLGLRPPAAARSRPPACSAAPTFRQWTRRVRPTSAPRPERTRDPRGGTHASEHARRRRRRRRRAGRRSDRDARARRPAAADADVPRPPAAVQVVLDRSGSMDGERLEAAKQALVRARRPPRSQRPLRRRRVRRRGPSRRPGRASSRTSTRPARAIADLARRRDDEPLRRAPARTAGGAPGRRATAGSTLLLALRRSRQRRARPTPPGSRVVAAGARDHGITTSTVGIGLGYDESLLADLARGGQGNHVFAEHGDGAAAAVAGEVEGLLSKTVQAASLLIRPRRRCRVRHGLERPARPRRSRAASWSSWATCGPARSASSCSRFAVPAKAALGLAQIAELELRYVALPDFAEQTVTIPVHVNVVPGDQAAGPHPRPEGPHRAGLPAGAGRQAQGVRRAARRRPSHRCRGATMPRASSWTALLAPAPTPSSSQERRDHRRAAARADAGDAAVGGEVRPHGPVAQEPQTRSRRPRECENVRRWPRRATQTMWGDTTMRSCAGSSPPARAGDEAGARRWWDELVDRQLRPRPRHGPRLRAAATCPTTSSRKRCSAPSSSCANNMIAHVPRDVDGRVGRIDPHAREVRVHGHPAPGRGGLQARALARRSSAATTRSRPLDADVYASAREAASRARRSAEEDAERHPRRPGLPGLGAPAAAGQAPRRDRARPRRTPGGGDPGAARRLARRRLRLAQPRAEGSRASFATSIERMTTIDEILGEFIDAWKAGQRPDVDAYLERVPAGERDELAAQLATWLADRPDARATTTRRPRGHRARSPACARRVERADAARRRCRSASRRLRERAGLAVRDVAARLAGVFGLADESARPRYLERLERDELDASAPVAPAARRAGGDARRRPRSAAVPGRRRLAPAQAFFRARGGRRDWIAQDIDALSRAALASAPAPMDELDRLFLGGPGRLTALRSPIAAAPCQPLRVAVRGVGGGVDGSTRPPAIMPRAPSRRARATGAAASSRLDRRDLVRDGGRARCAQTSVCEALVDLPLQRRRQRAVSPSVFSRKSAAMGEIPIAGRDQHDVLERRLAVDHRPRRPPRAPAAPPRTRWPAPRSSPCCLPPSVSKVSTATPASWPQRTWPSSCASVKRLRTAACVPLTQSTVRSPSRQQHPAIPSGSDDDGRPAARAAPRRASAATGRWLLRGQAELRPQLARPLGPDVRVLAGHGAGP